MTSDAKTAVGMFVLGLALVGGIAAWVMQRDSQPLGGAQTSAGQDASQREEAAVLGVEAKSEGEAGQPQQGGDVAQKTAPKSLEAYCDAESRKPLCNWVDELRKKAGEGHAASQALLEWVEVTAQATGQEDQNLEKLKRQLHMAALAEEGAFEEYQQQVRSWVVDANLAEVDLEEMKTRLEAMEEQILAMKLQGMTDAEAELLRLRLSTPGQVTSND